VDNLDSIVHSRANEHAHASGDRYAGGNPSADNNSAAAHADEHGDADEYGNADPTVYTDTDATGSDEHAYDHSIALHNVHARANADARGDSDG